jgi:deoxyhypusine synthase
MAGESGAGGGGRNTDPLEGVRAIVLKPSESLDESRFTRIAGADFNDAGLGLPGLLGSLASTGFQASNLGDAIDVVNQMVRTARFSLSPSVVILPFKHSL